MKICLFSSYSEETYIKNYVKFYLEMLMPHFDRVIFITNDRDLDRKSMNFINLKGIQLSLVKNEGFDFGMWYKHIRSIDENKVDFLCLVNDSCVAFKNLNNVFSWIDNSSADFCGIADSNEFYHHLQSYFMVFKSECIKDVKDYFVNNGIVKSGEVRDTIQTYEVGLSKYLQSKGYKMEAMFKSAKYMATNISLLSCRKMINDNCPLIKKKILTGGFRKHEVKYLKEHNYDFNFSYKKMISNKTKEGNLNTEYLFENLK